MKRRFEKSLKNRSKRRVACAEDDAWYDTLAHNSRQIGDGTLGRAQNKRYI